jgi:MFS family permease
MFPQRRKLTRRVAATVARMRAQEYLGPLRERPFRLLWFGRTASGVGDSVIYVALIFAVLDVGSKADLGLILAVFWLSRTVFVLAGGVWADRLPAA